MWTFWTPDGLEAVNSDPEVLSCEQTKTSLPGSEGGFSHLTLRRIPRSSPCHPHSRGCPHCRRCNSQVIRLDEVTQQSWPSAPGPLPTIKGEACPLGRHGSITSRPPAGLLGNWETRWPRGTAETVDLVLEVCGVGAVHTGVCSESRFHRPLLCPQAECLPSFGSPVSPSSIL